MKNKAKNAVFTLGLAVGVVAATPFVLLTLVHDEFVDIDRFEE